MKKYLKDIRNRLLGINELKVEIQSYINNREYSSSNTTVGKFNTLPASLVEVEELYVPIRGGFKDQSNNVTYTNMELESAYLISSLCALQRPQFVLETGTHEGYSAAHMACAMHQLDIDGHIYTFDPFTVAHRFENNELQKYVTWINDYSTNYKDYNLPKEFDFMLLDSDYTYKTLAHEVNIFEPMLKVGGILVLHDTIVFKDLWPVVDSINETGRFEVISFDTPRDWGNANGLNGSGLTICKKIASGNPIPVNEELYNNASIDAYIETLPADRIKKSKTSMFFNDR